MGYGYTGRASFSDNLSSLVLSYAKIQLFFDNTKYSKIISWQFEGEEQVVRRRGTGSSRARNWQLGGEELAASKIAENGI